jgi:ribosomal protein S12 methylthiotransferase
MLIYLRVFEIIVYLFFERLLMKKKKINIVTLGCSKNLVDSEHIIRQLGSEKFEVVADSNDLDADIVVINTCGFIKEAKEESIDTILEFAEAKKAGYLEKIYVMGCLSERYQKDLFKIIPEVDGFFGKFDFKKLTQSIGSEYKNELKNRRHITTPNHYAYLKISEGCNRTCSFCAIPAMTGKHKSIPIEDIIDEASSLVAKGTKELLVIAQDLSYYGLDIYKKPKLAELIKKLSDIKNLEWIRLHYAYPANFPFEVLQVMSERNNVCNYLDIAIQHISDNMLGRMRRNMTKQETIDLIRSIRNEVPGIAIRTTMLIGHPDETEDDFGELKNFVSDMRFEKLGVFAYSHEENTYSYKNYSDNISDEVKTSRQNEIMEMQQTISSQINNSKIGSTLKVLIDRTDGEHYVKFSNQSKVNKNTKRKQTKVVSFLF